LKRRTLLVAATALALAALPARGQAMPRVGFLVAGDAEPAWTLFRKEMAAPGYVEGRTIAYEFRQADADSGKLDLFAAELVRLKVDVLVPILSPAIVAARKATSAIPIVFFGAAPDIDGITNVARPEGNLTGMFRPSATLAGKGLQLFHSIKPGMTRFAALLNERDPFHVPLQRDIQAAADAEKVELLPILVTAPGTLAQHFESMVADQVTGVIVQPSLGLATAAELALKVRMPAISFRREFAEAGGFFSYGADQPAGSVDRVLKGAAPASLPVQQATRMELVVNQKTARTLGIMLPPMFLAQADEVIE